MKIFLLMVCVLAFLPYRARAENTVNPMAAFEANEVENRIRNHLANYLDPSQYMLLVRPRAEAVQKAQVKGDESLPGLPGFQTSGQGAVSYMNTDGRMILGTSQRSPVMVSLVFDHSVSAPQVKVFRDLLPGVAQLDTKRGDQIKITTGRLGRPPLEQAKEDNWIESLMRYRRELIALGLGLVGSIAFLLFIHGLMSAFARGRQPRKENKPGETKKPHYANNKSDENAQRMENAAKKADDKPDADAVRLGRFGSGSLNRSQMYSRDSLLFETVREVMEQAEKYPERLAQLLTFWIQSGEDKTRSAAMLLNNFDMKVTEAILAKMVPSDIEHLNQHLGPALDPFSDENARIMTDARQDILKLTALEHRSHGREDFQFLNSLDEDILKQLLDQETVETLALVATQTPVHRVANAIMARDAAEIQNFFETFCALDQVSEQKWTSVSSRLQQKHLRMKGSAISDKSKSTAVVNLVSRIKDSGLQKHIIARINELSPEISAKVRDSVILFEDLTVMPDRALRIFLLELDVFTVLKAFNEENDTVLDRLVTHLPKSNAEIFSFERKNRVRYSEGEVRAAQSELVSHAAKLVDTGAIQSSDVRPINRWGEKSAVKPPTKLAG